MTAEELITLLQALPPEIKIVVRGYEDGYNDIQQLKALKLKKEPNTEWYYGEYFEDTSEHAIDAIELFGEHHNQEGN
ncbi:MAG: hypothetical protein V5804_00825 [Mucilaginibacter sp.]|uniref:hypothetical protein n=1 Tax=Mucilaginibacter sp. TaxID=1882438 RepID=UPI0034E42606